MKRLGIAKIATLLMLITLILTSCWSNTNDTTSTPTDAPVKGYTLQPIFAEERFDMPVGLEHREGYPNLIYILEKPGRIVSKHVQKPADKAEVMLDITGRVYDSGGEQGLLGLSFHPKRPNEAYVNYTTETHTIIAKYDADPANPALFDPSSEQIVMTFEQPYSNHNGGQLAFGPDGYLYIATGDGGSGGDPHNNSQNLQSMLGKILRIDVDTNAEGKAYSIPSDNPFLKQGLPEIYAYGLRNPWRFSFDASTGKLWAADVGQNRFEEINLIEKGGNYGWRIQEGTVCYHPQEGCEQEGLEQPLFTYGRDQGVSITGGYVYRGEQIPELVGRYVYADYGTGTVWALSEQEGELVDNQQLFPSEQNITSFGRDARGEIYVCTQDGEVFQLHYIG